MSGPVLVVRGLGDAGASARALVELGVPAEALPVYAFETIAPPRELLERVRARRWDLGIAVSPRGVRALNALKLAPAELAGQWLAVGPRSARALAEGGVASERIAVPEVFSSEGLLGTPLLHGLGGHSALLVCGRGGRRLIQDRLDARGADWLELKVYRRIPEAFNPERFAQAVERAGALMLTSIYGVARLTMQAEMSGCRRSLCRLPAFALSERIAEAARSEGFARCSVAADSSIDSLHRLIAERLRG
ncbi:MAG: uroporphyrinogen-III synthase [Gammaproteobacteria bacterium AqS3]|nr:uroporphyrinogen-III synthase [Gammaproteobacteria bacterium AqS3]